MLSSCNKEARYTLDVESSTVGTSPNQTTTYRLFITNQKGAKSEITPSLPDGLVFGVSASFVDKNARRILVEGMRPNQPLFDRDRIFFTCDRKGKDVRRVNTAAGEEVQDVRY